MSLVDEALRKARAEAARQEAVRGGTPYAIAPSHARRRADGPWLPLAGLAVGVLAGVALAVVFLTRPPAPGGREEPRTPERDSRAAAHLEPAPTMPATDPSGSLARPAVPPATAPAASPVGEAPPGAPEVARDAVAAGDAEAPPAAAHRETAEPAGGSGTGGVSEAAAAPPAEAPGPATDPDLAAPAPAPAAPASAHRGRVDLGGGRTIALDGIAWGEVPIALVNGRVMGVGERVEGYTLVAIERRRIELADADATIVIELD